jgi:hypothetical protein
VPPCSGQSRPSPSGGREDAANLDGPCARRLRDLAVGTEECSRRGSNHGPKENNRRDTMFATLADGDGAYDHDVRCADSRETRCSLTRDLRPIYSPATRRRPSTRARPCRYEARDPPSYLSSIPARRVASPGSPAGPSSRWFLGGVGGIPRRGTRDDPTAPSERLQPAWLTTRPRGALTANLHENGSFFMPFASSPTAVRAGLGTWSRGCRPMAPGSTYWFW